MPANQLQYDRLITQLRSMGHILEQTPGNIGEALRAGGSRGAYVTETFHSDGGYAAVATEASHAADSRNLFDGASGGTSWNTGNTIWNTATFHGQDADGVGRCQFSADEGGLYVWCHVGGG